MMCQRGTGLVADAPILIQHWTRKQQLAGQLKSVNQTHGSLIQIHVCYISGPTSQSLIQYCVDVRPLRRQWR